MSDEEHEEKQVWVNLKRSMVWRPGIGEILEGEFLGFTDRHGKYGAYEVVLIGTPDCIYTASGSVLIDMLKINRVETGMKISVAFLGRVPILGTDRSWKKYEVRVAT